MKGIMFNVFEGFVTENWGDEFFEDILDLTTLQTSEAFVGPGTYTDADLIALVSTTIEKLGVPLHDALVAFGQYAFKQLTDSHPAFVQEHSDLRAFLKTVDSIIHIEVRKLYPEAVTPTVLVEDVSDDELRLLYKSERKLCSVAEGLLRGAADTFETDIEVEHTECMHKGAEQCVYQVRMSPQGVCT